MKHLFIKEPSLQFHRNRPKNNEVIAFLMIGYETSILKYFLVPLFLFFDFLGESKRSLSEKSNAVYPIKIGPVVFEISRGAESAPPPHQLTSSRKPTSNRVNLTAKYI